MKDLYRDSTQSGSAPRLSWTTAQLFADSPPVEI